MNYFNTMYEKIITDKSILVGDEKLLKKSNWVSYSEINESMAILKHKMFTNVFNKIIRDFKPTNNIAFISLCTSTRPYYLSRKWKTFISEFNNKVDLIVLSSGGIIPQQYWNSYPFLNYNGDPKSKKPEGFEKLYAQLMEKRLLKFFKTHKYDYVIANFRPKLRNTPVAHKVLNNLKKNKYIKDYNVIPSEKDYIDLQKRGFPNGKMFPDLDLIILEKLNNSILFFENEHIKHP